MLKFDDNKEATLNVGIITMKNVSNHDKTVEIYVPNRYDAFTVIPAGCKLTVASNSSGESFMYLAQADDDLTVELKEAAAVVNDQA